jgi:hypothetical protein
MAANFQFKPIGKYNQNHGESKAGLINGLPQAHPRTAVTNL